MRDEIERMKKELERRMLEIESLKKKHIEEKKLMKKEHEV
jgi:hypothetical protein